MDWLASLIAISLSMLFIGFFSGIEIAFVSANKLSLELKKKQGTYTGKLWGGYADKPAKFIGMTLVGLNIVVVVYGLLLSNFMDVVLWKNLDKYFHVSNAYVKLILETILSTLVLLFFEFTFKAFFRARNENVMNSSFVTYLVSFFYSIFSAIASIFVEVAEWILKYVFNVRIHEKREVFSKMDLEHFLTQAKNSDEEDTDEINKELFENALSLSETKLRECLIPRREIEAVDIKTSIGGLKDKFIKTQLSKLVVFDENIDNIQGYVHQLDLFKNPADIRAILHPIPTVPESMSATDMMSKFSKGRKTIAWVVDEFGGTAGIITMEDLLEEIFGDIKDEYDTEDFVEKQIAANEFIFSGRLELDYINEKYGLEFSGDETTETLSGYIIHNNEEIPGQKDRIIIGNYQYDILNMGETRIETVKLKVLK
jgi:CBS domain containing-hemolysin-like protein